MKLADLRDFLIGAVIALAFAAGYATGVVVMLDAGKEQQ